MKAPMWFTALCTKRYNKRQQDILRETAELIERRACKPYMPERNHSRVCKKR